MGFTTGIVAASIMLAGVNIGNAPDRTHVSTQAKDPQKLARLVALLQAPQQSITNATHYPELNTLRQPNGSTSSNISQGNVPTNNTETGTSTNAPANAPGNSMSNVGGAGTAGGGGGTIGTIQLGQNPKIKLTRLADVVGSDPASRRTVDRLIAANASQIKQLQGMLPYKDVVAVDVMPNGGLEIFTR